MPQNNRETTPKLPFVLQDEVREKLDTIVPDSANKPYDMHEVISGIIDEDSFFEIHKDFAENIIVGFARLGGRSIGIVANQPMVLAGCLDVNSSIKAARFVRFCDCFNIPYSLSLRPTQLVDSLERAIDIFIANKKIDVIGKKSLQHVFYSIKKEARVEFEDGDSQPMGTILECVTSLQSKFIPRPASLKSAAHKNFVLQERSRVIKRAQIQEYVTFVDPEKQKAERIRNKEDLMKQEKRSGGRRSTSGTAGVNASGRKRYGMHRAYMEGGEEEDDELYDSVNIRKLKRRNMDDEDMDYGDDAGMSEEEDAWSKRKKRVFESGRKSSHLTKFDSDEDEEMDEGDEEEEFVVDKDEDDDNEEMLNRKKQTSSSGQKRQASIFDDDDDDSD
jgi:hypothetical protein